jgi:hypothetical protein
MSFSAKPSSFDVAATSRRAGKFLAAQVANVALVAKGLAHATRLCLQVTFSPFPGIKVEQRK